MRFEISETVPTPDPEIVLRALEMCSRDVSSDVVRYGDRITLYGLGPSPRAKNVHDTTVFQVNAKDDRTVINGEVSFQASALLGSQAQDEVVRSKLEGLFHQMKAQIDLDSRRMSSRVAPIRSGLIGHEASAPIVEVVQPMETATPVAPETLMEAMDAAPEEGLAAAGLIGEAAIEAQKTDGLEREQEPSWTAREQSAEHVQEVSDTGLHSRWMSAWTIAFAMLALIVGAYFAYTYRDALMTHFTHEETPAVTTPRPAVVSSRRSVDAPAPPSSPQTAAAVQKTATVSAADVDDLTTWLQNWAAAMRTRDAEAQAAFYADSVDRYLGQKNITRDDVLREREATISIRKGLWTVKIERIAIVRQTNTEAEVRLVKHFIDEPHESEIQELLVPTRLLLKRSDGSWKITSEQDLS